MVIVRIVKLKCSGYYKKSNSTLWIYTCSKEFLIQLIVNGTIRNGYKY